MDIHGEDSFGLSRENGLLFRHNTHHMYFNDFSVPSSKALKELEDIDALSKHVIMKGLNDDEPNSPTSLDPRTPPRHIPSSSPDYTSEPSLKLEEDDELGSTFAFFRKPPTHVPSHLSHSVDDLLPQHHTSNNRHDFGFMQSFDLRTQQGKPKDSPNSPTTSSLNHHGSLHLNHHEHGIKSTPDHSMVPTISPVTPTIINNINNINNINHISNISTINHISNINNINNINSYNTINNNINISININSGPHVDSHKPPHHDDIPDPTTMMDDKSAIHLINNANSLEFLDDYITTGSNSSSSPDESPLNHEDEEMDTGLNDSTASLANALHNAAMVPISSPMPTPVPNGMHRITSAPVPPSPHAPHPAHNRLHHSTGSMLASSAPTSGSLALTSVDNSGYHSLTSSCNLVLGDPVGIELEPAGIPIVLPPGGTTVIDGVTYNNRGYEVCGSLNKFNKPCQRIGRCPFHHDSSSPKKGPAPNATTEGGANGVTAVSSGASLPPSAINPSGSANPPLSTPSATPTERRYLPIKKGPYKSGWKKDEHIRFLKGLQMHGKGSWKEIALIVGTRTPTQIQVHAHRYYLRQLQETKNKRSIHDISLQDLEELEVQHGLVLQSSISESTGSSTHVSPPSPPDRTHSNDLSHIFNSPHHHPPHHSQSTPTTPTHPHHHSLSTPPLHHPHSNPHLSTPLSTSSPSIHSHSPLSHSDGIPNTGAHLVATAMSSPPISAPSSPLVPPISSNFPPLFSGSATASSLSNTLPGLPFPTFPLAPSYYHSSPWFSAPSTPSSSFTPSSAIASSSFTSSSSSALSTSSPAASSYPIMSQMSNLNSMTINMSGLGDVDLHSGDQKLLSPLTADFSNVSDDDYDDDLAAHHHASSAHIAHHHAHHHQHSHPSSPEEEFPSDDD